MRRSHALALALLLSGASQCACAGDSPVDRVRDVIETGTSRLHDLLAKHLPFARRSTPDWIVEQSRDEPDPDALVPSDKPLLVLQEARRDGTDMLTLRYPLGARGPLRAYAGAGLSQAVYYADGTGAPELVALSDRARTLGAAAELGAELRVNSRLMLSADVRWADLGDEAVLLRSADGLVGADPVSMAVSVGWRFR